MHGLTRDLEHLIGSRHVFSQPEDLLAYTNDATHRRVMPEVAVQPGTTEEIARVLAYANNKLIPVIPRGPGTGLAGGATPVSESIVVDLKRLEQVLEVDTKNLTASVECGVVTQKFHTLFESMGLFYPPDPQSMLVCTLGGNVATRAGGPRGVKYGTTKDYVLGIEAVLPDGEVIHYGGKSVKMSFGYDLARLFTEAEGTLGIITKITFKLLTLPPYRRTMVAVFPELDDAAEVVSAIIAAGAVPSSLELLTKSSIETIESFIPLSLPKDAEAFLLIELDGYEGKVLEETQQITSICQEHHVRETKIARDAVEAERMWLARRVLFPAIARLSPNVAKSSFEQRVKAYVKPQGEIRGKVAYFIGCATNYLYPETGESVVKVLTNNGYEVIIPENQHCCRIPALAHGELAVAQDAVRWNADLFAALDVDAIITDCTSCGYMLKVKAAKTLDINDPYQEKVAKVANKDVEITEFVTRENFLRNDLISKNNGTNEVATTEQSLKVTYHVPCYRSWSPNLIQAPRKLIPMLLAVNPVEMKEPQKCCGAGGSFFIDYEDVAESIRGRKLEAFIVLKLML